MPTALRQLLDRARGPMGPPVELDFGVPSGPLVELANSLRERNGFFVFNAGVQVFRAGPEGLGYDIELWNAPGTWKDAYGGLADDVFWFGQDLFGAQFGIVDGHQVIVMDPETAQRQVIGDSLEDWAAWLWQDPELHGQAETAFNWQEKFGGLDVTERLVHRQPLALGGDHGVDNVLISDAVRLLRALGPLAVTLREVPPGTPIEYRFDG
jgi:hypothetical protein